MAAAKRVNETATILAPEQLNQEMKEVIEEELHDMTGKFPSLAHTPSQPMVIEQRKDFDCT